MLRQHFEYASSDPDLAHEMYHPEGRARVPAARRALQRRREPPRVAGRALMTADDVVAVLAGLAEAGVDAIVDGGRGVDAPI
jgi:hypothetical protein